MVCTDAETRDDSRHAKGSVCHSAFLLDNLRQHLEKSKLQCEQAMRPAEKTLSSLDIKTGATPCTQNLQSSPIWSSRTLDSINQLEIDLEGLSKKRDVINLEESMVQQYYRQLHE